MPKKFLSVNDVAKLLGVTPLTVRNWDKAGKLLAYRNPVNNYRMYKVEDVEGLMRTIENSRGQSFPRVTSSPPPEPEEPKTRKLKIETL
ncbi:MAG: helix-turn-helix domain-containing protein [bacterium]|nr:helix-turn-helix domain-containing protein [bacterium]